MSHQNGPLVPPLILTYAKLPRGRLWHILLPGTIRARCGAPQDMPAPCWHRPKTRKPPVHTICVTCRTLQVQWERRYGRLWTRLLWKRWGLG